MPKVVQKIAEVSIKRILQERSVQVIDESLMLKKRRTALKHQRESVMMRYGLGEIPKDVYELSKKNLDKDIEQLNIEISRLEKKSSNPVLEVLESQEKTGKSFDFPAVVDYSEKLSNFLEDLRKVKEFIKSIGSDISK